LWPPRLVTKKLCKSTVHLQQFSAIEMLQKLEKMWWSGNNTLPFVQPAIVQQPE